MNIKTTLFSALNSQEKVKKHFKINQEYSFQNTVVNPITIFIFNYSLLNQLISYINVQKSTDFKSQEKRERNTGHACNWGRGADRQKERKIRNQERKKRADNNNLGKGRDREEKTETKRKKGLDTCKARVAPTCFL
jgi:hypothetical protein